MAGGAIHRRKNLEGKAVWRARRQVRPGPVRCFLDMKEAFENVWANIDFMHPRDKGPRGGPGRTNYQQD